VVRLKTIPNFRLRKSKPYLTKRTNSMTPFSNHNRSKMIFFGVAHTYSCIHNLQRGVLTFNWEILLIRHGHNQSRFSWRLYYPQFINSATLKLCSFDHKQINYPMQWQVPTSVHKQLNKLDNPARVKLKDNWALLNYVRSNWSFNIPLPPPLPGIHLRHLTAHHVPGGGNLNVALEG